MKIWLLLFIVLFPTIIVQRSDNIVSLYAIIDSFPVIIDWRYSCIDWLHVVIDWLHAFIDWLHAIIDSFYVIIVSLHAVVDWHYAFIDSFPEIIDSFHATIDSFPAVIDEFQSGSRQLSDMFPQGHVAVMNNVGVSTQDFLQIWWYWEEAKSFRFADAFYPR